MSSAAAASDWSPVRAPPTSLQRLFDNKAFLITICLLPAAGLLLVFLTYPLGPAKKRWRKAPKP